MEGERMGESVRWVPDGGQETLPPKKKERKHSL
jgi:hypothetical protein